MNVKTFYDDRTSTLTYVVFDEETRDAVIIDPVLDYDPKASKTWTESADEVVEWVQQQDLIPHMILETHAHADHLSGSQYIKKAFPDATLGIGEHITDVQTLFKQVFDLPEDFPTDGRQFDRLFETDEEVDVGSLRFKVLYTPGHTPADVSFLFRGKDGEPDAVFTGDALFMPDMGTGRCDFPGGSAEDMYDSITDELYTLPDETRVFVGHDYQPGDRQDVAWESTIGEQKRNNVRLDVETSREEFVTNRQERDASLDAPVLLFQSVQVNVDAGHLPKAHDNEIRYLRIPINVFRPDTEEGETEEREVRAEK
jgi:glyoxylase-like metal-dependent hydrolase (beta-lactamase superfamily II)